MITEAPSPIRTDPETTVHTVLLVDDEPSVLTALQRALRPDGYRLLTAGGGPEALEQLTREPVAVIVSDQRMPHMSGAKFLEIARQMQPDAGRILLTGYAEPQAIIDAINLGGIYRFIAKPWEDSDLRLTLRRAVDQHRLVKENQYLSAELHARNVMLEDINHTLEARVVERTREVAAQHDQLRQLYTQLDQSFADSIRVFVSLLELRDGYLAGHARRVATAARFIAGQMHLNPLDVRDIEIAATLHEIGRISLPDSLLTKPEASLTATERSMLQRCPIVGQAIVMGIGHLQSAGRLIYYHQERFDGLGHPDRLAGEEIPLGSRIIAVADALDRMLFAPDDTIRRTTASVRDELARQAQHQFDPTVVLAALTYLDLHRQHPQEARQTKVALHVLQPGMTLARDLVTAQGVLLMPRDTLLTPSHVERIRNYARVYMIGTIHVYALDEHDRHPD